MVRCGFLLSTDFHNLNLSTPLLFIFFLLLAQSQSVMGQSRERVFDPQPGRLVIKSNIDLPEIVSSELLLGSQAQAVREIPPTNLGFTSRVKRPVPSIWGIYVLPGVNPESLIVTYEMNAENGTPGRLNLVGDLDSEIRVQIVPIRPVVVERLRDVILIEGGVVMDLDVTEAQKAGKYSGVLTVSIHQL